MKSLVLIVLCLVVLPAAASPQSRLDYGLRAPLPDSLRTRILILGSDHLDGLGDRFEPGMVANLLAALERFHPDVVAVESPASREIARLSDVARRTPAGPAAQLLDAFSADMLAHAREAQAALAVGPEEAATRVSALAGRSSTARRRIPALFLAAYDLPNAALCWARMSAADRAWTSDSVSTSAAAYLSKYLHGPNEIASVAIALARRLGLDRLASVDDHIDDEVGIATGLNDTLMVELQQTEPFRELASSPYFREAATRLGDAASTRDLLPLYLKINSADHIAVDVASQWHIFHRTHLKSGHDRMRAALWEARNLIIASRIREASAAHPGGRVLVVIGAAHKPFLDDYLARMMDVEIVQLADFVE